LKEFPYLLGVNADDLLIILPKRFGDHIKAPYSFIKIRQINHERQTLFSWPAQTEAIQGKDWQAGSQRIQGRITAETRCAPDGDLVNLLIPVLMDEYSTYMIV
jgi:hypothetical protein